MFCHASSQILCSVLDYSKSVNLLHMAEIPWANLKHGLGLITRGDWAHGLQSTGPYIKHANNKDWQRLLLQPNPIANDK
ncbi:uncharacterized protein BJX67DRAFT_316576 [Aspergillus lucknowensis]|uniref:Uncharacterized protein n=1 Tax=Aspergillus lucknowensis TaxID=176173 RepID=A0ABR4L956_9EURO